MRLPVVYDPIFDMWVRFRVVSYGWPSVMKALFFVSVMCGIVNYLVGSQWFKDAVLKIVASRKR